MLSHHQEVEPLVPMGLLTTVLDCNVTCGKDKTCKWSIRWGGGWKYPTVSRKLALELIEEIEKKRGGWLKEINFNGEETWLRFPARSHPVLYRLPEHIYKTKVGWRGGSLEWLTGEQIYRKRFEKNGLMVHFFAGPDEGMTLRKAMQEQGEPIEKLLELDILRGSTHDVISEETYGGFLRACFEA